jgi:parvulin-like peptidyl-prolyl isomerase
MSETLKIGDRTLTAEEIIPLLAGYRMLPQLRRELIIDRAIAALELTLEEQTLAQQQFVAKHQLSTPEKRQAWADNYSLTGEQLSNLAQREYKIEKFKIATWSAKIESYFLTHKSQFDRAIYSLLRTKDREAARELYFRIKDREQTFAECAREYSQGPEAETGGLLGPMELSRLHPTLAKMLSLSQPGQLWVPTPMGEWMAIVRLEKLIPAQLDAPMRQHLLDRMFEEWVAEQLKKSPFF